MSYIKTNTNNTFCFSSDQVLAACYFWQQVAFDITLEPLFFCCINLRSLEKNRGLATDGEEELTCGPALQNKGQVHARHTLPPAAALSQRFFLQVAQNVHRAQKPSTGF